MKRRTLIAGLAGLATPALAQDRRAETLRFVPQSNLAVLDPVWTTATVTNGHGNYVFDTLYGSDSKLTPRPQMAEGAETSPDGRTWRIRLREGLWFHDGTPVRAQDCAASLARWCRRDAFGQLLAKVTESMTAEDDRTLVIRLTRPFPIMLDALGKAENPAFIMPERLAKTDANTAITEMVGSGPYRWVAGEYNSGSRAVYEKFDKYVPRSEAPEWTSGAKVAHFRRVEWIVIPDGATAAAALANGEVDWWERPLVDLIPSLKSNPAVTVPVADPGGRLAVMRLNALHPPFNNPKIRRAVMAAVNQEDHMRAARGDDPSLWSFCRSIFPKGTPDHADMADLMPADLTAAKRLLAASGYGGEKLVLLNPTDYPDIGPLGQMTNEVMRKLGMNVDFVETDWGSVIQRRASRETVENRGWSAFHTTGSASGWSSVANNFLVRGQGEKGWFGWWKSDEVEALADQWLTATDATSQHALARQINRLAMEGADTIPVGQFFLQTAYRKSLTGVLQGPNPYPWNVRRV